MKYELDSLSALSNQQLREQVATLATREREATARLIAALAEMESRRLYLAEGFSSLFTYCTQALHFFQDAAYNRTRAAGAARRWPGHSAVDCRRIPHRDGGGSALDS